ncbi:MAG: hypothetical protein ACE14L_11295 [Terriglobales bacterium]
MLPLHHRHPFDRLLVAQAQCFNIPIVTADTALAECDVKPLVDEPLQKIKPTGCVCDIRWATVSSLKLCPGLQEAVSL